jgi:hypothetical protein|tara:strand:+ start:47 stop:937 length:891 start_codon:yes stop_codon:yes gene_type:complete
MSDELLQTIEETVNAFYPDATTEPLEVLTEEAATDEKPAEVVAESSEDDTKEAEEEASDDTDENKDDDSDNLVYEINGKDYSAKDIELLESGQLMQADYTKKTQALAQDREKLDSDVTLLSESITKTNDLAAQLEVLVDEDKDINWAELKEDDPDEYIKLKERADSRKSKLEEVKANNQTSNVPQVDVEAERVKLVEANPQWLKDSKPTQAYKDDMQGLNDFYQEGEWTQDQVNLVNGNAKLAQLVIESIRSKKEQASTDSKKASAKKKIIATPKSGKAKVDQSTMSAEEVFYGSN